MSKRTFEPDWLWSPVQGRHFTYNGWQNQYNYTRMVATPKELQDWDDFWLFLSYFPQKSGRALLPRRAVSRAEPRAGFERRVPNYGFPDTQMLFQLSSNMHEMARDVSWGLHTEKLNPGATPSLTAEHLVPSGYQTELFETGHFCRSKMIQYPPQQSSQQFYF